MPGSSVGIVTGYGLDGPVIEPRWGARFSAPVQTGPGAHPASCTRGTGSFPGVKSCQGVTLTPHPLLVPWSRKGRAILLFPLWAVRPVQSLSACTRVHFTMCNRVPHKVIFLFRYCVKNQTGNYCMLITDLYSFLCEFTNTEILGPAHRLTSINVGIYGHNVFPLD